MLRGDVGLELGQRVAQAVRAAFGVELTAEQALIRPGTPGRGGDYQCNVAMSLAKRVGQPSPDVARAIVDQLDTGDLTEPPSIAGPGFVNLTLRRSWLERHTAGLLADERIGVPEVAIPGRYVVDLSGPNVAKEMHVGHLRSTVIGDALCRLLEFAGHEVTRRNHLGDWGTPFGMLIEHLVDEGWTRADTDHTIGDLNAFYRDARKKFDAEPGFAERARLRVVSLQGGDESTLALWRDLVAESERHFERVYELLDVLISPSDSYGESFYNPYLADTITELEAAGLARISEGAMCVFPPGFTGRDGEALPIIIRKSDGGYTYGTTDLAAVRYWTGQRGATDLVYVVGTPQKQHFAMVFTTSGQAGWLDDDHRAVHVPFGSVLGEDGRMLRTRSGDSVRLVDLLTEAVDRAGAVVAERTELDEAERRAVAHAVGIGAVKYADLSSDREKDYLFSWSKMLAMEGNTSVYLQYANARIQSVIRRAGGRPETAEVRLVLPEPAERALALKLAQFPAAINATVEAFEPHKLCGYLYEAATAFSGFYENCPILGAGSEELTRSRLALADLTSRTIVRGLNLLGIDAPDRL